MKMIHHWISGGQDAQHGGSMKPTTSLCHTHPKMDPKMGPQSNDALMPP